MKKLINRPEDVVEEMIEGLVALNPNLKRLFGQTVLVRADAEERDRQVAIISGGGSGHEPAHAGYIGRGMLSAAVAGEVFTSPSPDAILAAIRAVTGKPGALLIVKNYTGDRLNFGLAAELARAEGLAVEMVLVADDVALVGTTEKKAQRGIAGTVFVHKVAGAAAEAGLSLPEVAAEAQAAADAVVTMGVGLSAATVPIAGKPGFSLGEREIELGLGIHGEPGVRRGPMETANLLVEQLLDPLLNEGQFSPPDRLVLLVNNLGGTTTMELAIVARHALVVLEERGLVVERTYVGTFLSALEMAGVSLSLLRVDDAQLARLDAPTTAPAWPKVAVRPQSRLSYTAEPLQEEATRSSEPPRTQMGQRMHAALLAATNALIEASSRLTEMDQVVGDGDLGISLERGSRAVQLALPSYPLDDPAATLHDLSLTLQRALGGSSGPLYAVFFLRASNHLRSGPSDDPKVWAAAFQAGCAGIGELGGATPGDRTMLDALVPAADALQSTLDNHTLSEAFAAAVKAAEAGAAATANLVPQRGRSSYIGDRALGHPDPGAEAVTVWLRALLPFFKADAHH